MTPEKIIETYLREQCKKHGFLCYKFAPCGNNGVPDRVVIGNGKTIFVELKAPGKKTRALQDAVHQQMREAGAIVFVIDTKQKVDTLIKHIERS